MRRRNWLASLLALFFVVVMPFAVARFVWVKLPDPKDLEKFATAFGEIAGTLFAGLAFAGLIYTALMQREELSLQRKELKDTREELSRTADAQEASEKALITQVEVAQLTARLNAATTLLEHYRSISISSPGIIGESNFDENRKKREKQIKERARNMESVLEEINGLKSRLAITVEGGPVAMQATATLRAEGTVIRAGSEERDA